MTRSNNQVPRKGDLDWTWFMLLIFVPLLIVTKGQIIFFSIPLVIAFFFYALIVH